MNKEQSILELMITLKINIRAAVDLGLEDILENQYQTTLGQYLKEMLLKDKTAIAIRLRQAHDRVTELEVIINRLCDVVQPLSDADFSALNSAIVEYEVMFDRVCVLKLASKTHLQIVG